MGICKNPVKYEEEFIQNSRNMRLFTCRWLPTDQLVKAVVFLCHGYGMETSIFMKGTGMRLAKAGYAVYGIDYEGHGKSEGLRCYIDNFSTVVDDCADFFKSVRELPQYRNKASFLYGESMGGAVALLLHRKEPTIWNGAVLVAPMCKISEKLKPNPFITNLLIKISPLIATWKIVPSNDIINSAFKDPIKREEIRANPYAYQGKPRVKTGLELLKASTDIEQNLDEITFPFLVLHGEEDTVTDPQCSKDLYNKSQSFDKSIKIYKGMWHGLTVAEPDDSMELVFKDITDWLDLRSLTGTMAAEMIKQADLESLVGSPLSKHRNLNGVHQILAVS